VRLQLYQARTVYFGDVQRRVQARALVDVASQGFLQQVAGSKIARADRGIRNTERGCDILDAELLDCAHYKNRPVTFGQRADMRLEELAHLAVLCGTFGPGFVGHQIIRLHIHSCRRLRVAAPLH